MTEEEEFNRAHADAHYAAADLERRTARFVQRCAAIEVLEWLASFALSALFVVAFFTYLGLWTGVGVLGIYALTRLGCKLSAERAIANIRTLNRER